MDLTQRTPTCTAVHGSHLRATWVAALGAVALIAMRTLVQTGLDQPVDCPCGAVLCRCGGIDMTCAGPAPLILHAARTTRR